MPDYSNMRLGKKPPVINPLTPKLYSLVMPSLSTPLLPPPEKMDYSVRVDNWPLFDNDVLGCCAIATVGHLIELCTSYTKPVPMVMRQDEIVEAYSLAGGYNPSDPTSDRGCIISNVLNLWLNQGVHCEGFTDKIAGFARINVRHPVELKYALTWFGGVYIGVDLPMAWQVTENWSMPPNTLGDNAPGSWGGHAVAVVAYDPEGVTVVSWGQKIKMDWLAYQTYCDEAWAVLSAGFINQQGLTPVSFDWPYLLSAMRRIQNGSLASINF